MSITTKRGDDGSTDLFGGQRVKKSDPRILAISAVDELNSNIGVLRTLCDEKFLEKIQNDLFELGAILANPKAENSMDLKSLEEECKTLEAALPPIRNFILPGGNHAAAEAHRCRAVCRRAETLIPQDLIPYVNRLSDYLFLLARSLNLKAGNEEVFWKKL